MNASTFQDSHTVQGIKADARAIADETLKVAQERLVKPAVDATRRAADFTRDAMSETREQLSRKAAQAEHFIADQMDRSARWVVANPLTSMGIVLAAGVVMSAVLTPSKR